MTLGMPFHILWEYNVYKIMTIFQIPYREISSASSPSQSSQVCERSEHVVKQLSYLEGLVMQNHKYQ